MVDLRTATVTDLWPLGMVDRSLVPFDASDKDGEALPRTWPVQAFRLPDANASYQVKGRTYLVTADEGETRDWDGYSEEIRIKDLGDEEEGLAPVCASVAKGTGMTLEELLEDENLGRLKITSAQGLSEDGPCYDTLYAFGSRGLSVWSEDGQLISSSADGFERITASALPTFFNSNHGSSGFDNRSDDKGPEPEGVTLGKVGGRTYAFVGLERVGGVMAYDVTNPAAPQFVTYVNNRDFSAAPKSAAAGDLGPEGLTFIPAEDSPNGAPLLVVANEVSGSTTTYSVDRLRRR